MELPDFLTRDKHGEINLTDHRIGLHHVLRYYNQGDSAEMLANRYPTLALSTIHRTIAFYLDQRQEVDAYLAETDRQIARMIEEHDRNRRGPTADELRRRLEARRAAGAA